MRYDSSLQMHQSLDNEISTRLMKIGAGIEIHWQKIESRLGLKTMKSLGYIINIVCAKNC